MRLFAGLRVCADVKADQQGFGSIGQRYVGFRNPANAGMQNLHINLFLVLRQFCKGPDQRLHRAVDIALDYDRQNPFFVRLFEAARSCSKDCPETPEAAARFSFALCCL